jgi:hypothetical protein
MTHQVFENEWVTCLLDDSLPVLKHVWKQETPGEIFRKNLLTIADHYVSLVPDYPFLAWLADTQKLGEVDEETEKWFAEVWEDLLFNQAGVKIHAVILGEDFYADYPMEKFKMDAERKHKNRGIELGVFMNEEDAYEWIRTR